ARALLLEERASLFRLVSRVGGPLGRLAQRLELGAAGKPVQASLLELARLLGGDPELHPGLPERPRLVPGQPEAKPDDVPLVLGERRHQLADAAVPIGLRDLLERLGPLTGQQVAERGLAVVADRLIETGQRAIELAQLDHLAERQFG